MTTATLSMGRYKAVGKEELREILGSQCSPYFNREGYVIGPDSNGRLCHVASCFSMSDARRHATEANERDRLRQEASELALEQSIDPVRRDME